uniref:Prohibitin n=1 Tax=Odontella aurita TaxID=265563 RepID=A0A7S4IUS6_9STRA
MPDQLRKSIEMKAQAEQDAERMDYELEKEKKKAEQDAALMMIEAEQDAKRMDYELEKDKKQAEQDAALMEYTLQQERKEAERKAIEAQGIADFQSIVSDGISENLLKWKGIEATEKLADSDNAKMVIMGGGGSGGLPVILSGGD